MPCRFIACILSTLLLGSAARGSELNVHGTTYKTACGAALWAENAITLREVAQGHFPDLLERLNRIYLCNSGSRAKAELLRFAPKLVQSVVSDLDGEKRSRVPASQALEPHGAKAWNMTATAMEADVQVDFLPNEACVKSVSFRRVQTGWLIVQVAEGCD